jgi:hypothetical protein
MINFSQIILKEMRGSALKIEEILETKKSSLLVLNLWGQNGLVQ